MPFRTQEPTCSLDANLEIIHLDMTNWKEEISAISKAIQNPRFPVPSALSYPWTTSPTLAENVLLLDAIERRVLMPMMLMSSLMVSQCPPQIVFASSY
jgi:hypothetical protein